ncbi:MAG: pantoate--beta-alanine ligase [Gemmatimonadota bacterium]
MQTETTRRGLRRALAEVRAAGKRIVLVPTMGYLHEGHLTLVDRAKRHGDVVVMSIFVNPLQFGPGEDLATYPRDPERDAALAQARGVDLMFVPSSDEMYRAVRPAVTVMASQLARILEGQFRPDHFEGVLTVVAKLLNIVQPDAAVFGQKDFQQWVLVKRMCEDLDFPCDIVVAPTVREPDGLAMSSRNAYLGEADRASALLLSRALRAAREKYAAGERSPRALIGSARAVLAGDPRVRVQYVELSDARTLETPDHAVDDSVLSVAALVGKARLIDNMAMTE